mgnify:CR=1 FL=1
MTEVIRSDGIEIKKKVIQQILLMGSGDSKFNNHINKSLKLLNEVLLGLFIVVITKAISLFNIVKL